MQATLQQSTEPQFTSKLHLSTTSCWDSKPNTSTSSVGLELWACNARRKKSAVSLGRDGRRRRDHLRDRPGRICDPAADGDPRRPYEVGPSKRGPWRIAEASRAPHKETTRPIHPCWVVWEARGYYAHDSRMSEFNLCEGGIGKNKLRPRTGQPTAQVPLVSSCMFVLCFLEKN